MANTIPSYTSYQKLNVKNREIRVLSITVSNTPIQAPDNILICSLSSVSLDKASPFFALSYVWGDAAITRPILIDNQVVHVRENLWHFLHALHDNWRSRPRNSAVLRVWVDYVCINQADFDERSTQVAMMGSIYSSADAVYAWLGPGTDESDVLFRCLEDIKSMRTLSHPWLQVSKEKQGELAAFQDVLLRAYWTRLWIIQEVVLPRQLWFFCGECVAHWEDVRFALTMSISTPKPPRALALAHANQSGWMGGRREHQTQYVRQLLELRGKSAQKAPLSDLVHRFRIAQCTDGRDRIYGLLSLAEQNDAAAIRVDYDKPLLQVLLEALSYWVAPGTLSERQDADQGRGLTIVRVAQFESLIAQLLAMMTPDHLAKSENLLPTSDEATVWCALRSIRERRHVRCDLVGVVDSTSVVPLSRSAELSGHTKGYISHVRGASSQGTFVYTVEPPGSHEKVIRTGQQVYFIRADTITGDPHHLELGSCTISARGIQVEDHGEHRGFREAGQTKHSLRDVRLPHPCQWIREQVPGSEFVLPDVPVPRSRNFTGDSVPEIACNILAIGTILRESQWLAECSEESDAVKDAEVSSSTWKEPEVPVWWSPWDFGLATGVLQPCAPCRMQEPAESHLNHHLLRSGQQSRRAPEVESCSCRWQDATA